MIKQKQIEVREVPEQNKVDLKSEIVRPQNQGDSLLQRNIKHVPEVKKDNQDSHKVQLQNQLELLQRLNDQLKLDLGMAQTRVKGLRDKLTEAEKALEHQKIKFAETEKALEHQKNFRPVVV